MEVPPGHVAVMVPHGHTVHVQAPGSMNGVANAAPAMQNPAAATGMIHDPATQGALSAMNAALPTMEQTTEGSSKTKAQPARKKSESKAATKKEREKDG